MTLLIFYLLLALGVSFLCSVLEACLLSVSPSFVKNLEDQGNRAGRIMARLKNNIERPLAAILSLNTIAHTVGAAGVGAQAAQVFGQAYFAVISAVLTLLILFFSEIIPKTIGAVYWKQLAGFTAYTCRFIIIGLYPLVWISEKLTRLISPGADSMPKVSRDEVVAMAQLGQAEGVIAEDESRIIRNLIKLQKILVEDVMTPRQVVGLLPEALSCGEAVSTKPVSRFSRIPVHSGDPDKITGYVLKQEILGEVASDRHSTELTQLKRTVAFVSEKQSLSEVSRTLLHKREHLAVVVDQHGGLAGVVTNEDLIETLLGLEIVDEVDQVADLRKLARSQWVERARKLGIDLPLTPPDSAKEK